jgi:hypothetical protein
MGLRWLRSVDQLWQRIKYLFNPHAFEVKVSSYFDVRAG